MKQWFNINTANPPTGYAAEVAIYDEIGAWGMSASDFANRMEQVKGRVLVRVGSNGGSILDGVSIYNYLRSRSGGVDTVCDSWAASIASIIFLAGEKRTMGTGSFIMVHRAWTVTQGNAQDLREDADTLEKLEAGSRAIYAERTDASDKDLDEWFDGKDHWLDADEAELYGFATERFNQLRAVASAGQIECLYNRYKSIPRALKQQFNAPAAAAVSEQQVTTTDKEIHMKDLLLALGLDENATEAAAIEAVNKLKAEHAAALASEAETAEAADNVAKEAADDLVARAIADGKIKAEAKDSWVANALKDYKSAKALLDGIAVSAKSVQPAAPFGATEPAPLKGFEAVKAAAAKSLNKLA